MQSKHLLLRNLINSLKIGVLTIYWNIIGTNLCEMVVVGRKEERPQQWREGRRRVKHIGHRLWAPAARASTLTHSVGFVAIPANKPTSPPRPPSPTCLRRFPFHPLYLPNNLPSLVPPQRSRHSSAKHPPPSLAVTTHS